MQRSVSQMLYETYIINYYDIDQNCMTSMVVTSPLLVLTVQDCTVTLHTLMQAGVMVSVLVSHMYIYICMYVCDQKGLNGTLATHLFKHSW